jgi:hypothetical protein
VFQFPCRPGEFFRRIAKPLSTRQITRPTGNIKGRFGAGLAHDLRQGRIRAADSTPQWGHDLRAGIPGCYARGMPVPLRTESNYPERCTPTHLRSVMPAMMWRSRS